METINSRAQQAIKTFLARRGFDILEEGWAHGKDSIDFIARDEDNELVFIIANIASEGNELPVETLNRKSLERVAAAYLVANTDLPEGVVRFDAVSLLVLGSSKALIRHHRSVFNDSGTAEV